MEISQLLASFYNLSISFLLGLGAIPLKCMLSFASQFLWEVMRLIYISDNKQTWMAWSPRPTSLHCPVVFFQYFPGQLKTWFLLVQYSQVQCFFTYHNNFE